MYNFYNSRIAFPIYCEDNVSFKNCEIHKNVKIGRYSYANNSVFRTYVNIGRYTSIGRGCIIGCGIHEYKYFTTSPYIKFNVNNKDFQHEKNRFLEYGVRTRIGNDCWIGDHVIIFSGVEIGDGAVIGAGAIVNKNVQPYEIVAGCPARHIRFRFCSDIIKKLLDIKWWDFDLSTINDVAYKEIEKFFEEILKIDSNKRIPINYATLERIL